MGKHVAEGCLNFMTFSLGAVLVVKPTVSRRLRRRPQTQSDSPTSIFHLGQLYNQLNAMWAIGVCVTWWASNPLGACQVTLHFNFEHSLQSCLCLCRRLRRRPAPARLPHSNLPPLLIYKIKQIRLGRLVFVSGGGQATRRGLVKQH